MAINWSHLPKEVQDAVCLNWSGNCGKGADNRGYVHDPATGYFVCWNCRKPAPLVGVKECETCNKPFVPKIYKPNALGLECDDCNPPHRVKRGKINLEL